MASIEQKIVALQMLVAAKSVLNLSKHDFALWLLAQIQDIAPEILEPVDDSDDEEGCTEVRALN